MKELEETIEGVKEGQVPEHIVVKRYICIVKTYGEMKRTKLDRHLPDHFPAAFAEYRSAEEAHFNYPGKEVMTNLEFKGYMLGLYRSHIAGKKTLAQRLRFW